VRKLKKADKNLKELFADLKREIIDKGNDEDPLVQGSSTKIREAKNEAKGNGKQFIRFLY